MLRVVGDLAPTGADLVHPGLAMAAAVVNAWLGREVLQGGVVLGPSGGIAVLGPSRAGKSTVLASAMLAGHTVVADELVVVDRGRALAGPATMSVRGDSARALAITDDRCRALRGQDAITIPVGDAPSAVPLIGWVELGWGATPSVRSLGPAARLAALGRHRRHGNLHHRADALMALAELPGWSFVRPPDPAGRAAGDALIDRLLHTDHH